MKPITVDAHDATPVIVPNAMCQGRSVSRSRIDSACQEFATKVGADEKAVATLRNELESVMYYASGDLPAYRTSRYCSVSASTSSAIGCSSARRP